MRAPQTHTHTPAKPQESKQNGWEDGKAQTFTVLIEVKVAFNAVINKKKKKENDVLTSFQELNARKFTRDNL